ncbi:MAG: SDR family oxidoreductase [Candidatus Eremiobacteraeota bacterium]|nr:SDR family oxidoreductase [Candidatus Eremiobacteraeota bacterium]
MYVIAPFRLDDRVAVVTGASSGLGARFARVLSAAGAKLVLAARRKDRLEALARELGDALPVACDVTDEAQVSHLFDAAMKRYGQIDILVNGAGDADPYAAEEEPLKAFADIIALNLTAAFSVAQHAARPMLARGRGSIINMASVLGLVGGGLRAVPGYAASKGGLVNLTRELALEWAGRGVRVNALAPAYFESELTAGIFANKKALEVIGRMTPMGRPGLSHELDGPLLFLASDASSYVTGQILAVDGGYLAH